MTLGTSLVVQRLRLCAPNAGVIGSIPGWEAKIPTCPNMAKKIFNEKIKYKTLYTLQLAFQRPSLHFTDEDLLR